MLFTLATIANY